MQVCINYGCLECTPLSDRWLYIIDSCAAFVGGQREYRKAGGQNLREFLAKEMKRGGGGGGGGGEECQIKKLDVLSGPYTEF